MNKVLVVTNSLSGGGAERSMNLLANLLQNNGVDTYLMPINFGDPDAIDLECTVMPSIRVWRVGFLRSVSSFFKFRRIVQIIKPQIVILNCELPELFAFFLPFRIKIITVEHTSKPWIRRKLLGLLVRLYLRSRHAQWVLVSEHLKRKRIYGRDVRVIPNLISSREGKLILKKATKLQRLVFIGRLSPEKNPLMFLQIAQASNMAANIIGDGELASILRDEVAKDNLAIQFSGKLDNPWGVISQGDLLIVTSNYEGDGLVILEALDRGIPILLRDVPDLRRFNFPEKNYFRTIGEAKEIIISNSISCENLTVSNNISENILKGRNPVVILEKWSHLINSN